MPYLQYVHTGFAHHWQQSCRQKDAQAPSTNLDRTQHGLGLLLLQGHKVKSPPQMQLVWENHDEKQQVGVQYFFFFSFFIPLDNPPYVRRERRTCKTRGGFAPKRSRWLGNASPCQRRSNATWNSSSYAVPDGNSNVQAQLHQLCAVVAVLTSEDAQTHTSHRQHGTEEHSTAPCAGPCSQQHPQNTNLIH